LKRKSANNISNSAISAGLRVVKNGNWFDLETEKMNTYYVYLTDVFGGNLNYSWVTKLRVKANSIHGVLCKVSRVTSLNFRAETPEAVYMSTSGLTGLVIDDAEYPDYDYSDAEAI